MFILKKKYNSNVINRNVRIKNKNFIVKTYVAKFMQDKFSFFKE